MALMKVVVFIVFFVVVWQCTRAVPLLSERATTHHHPCDHGTHHREERGIGETVKNATRYVGTKLHVIKRQATPAIPTGNITTGLQGNQTDSVGAERSRISGSGTATNETAAIATRSTRSETNITVTSSENKTIEETTRSKRNITDDENHKNGTLVKREVLEVVKNVTTLPAENKEMATEGADEGKSTNNTLRVKRRTPAKSASIESEAQVLNNQSIPARNSSVPEITAKPLKRSIILTTENTTQENLPPQRGLPTNETKTKRSADEYLLIYDVPPYKRSTNNETVEKDPKNVTAHIQNLASENETTTSKVKRESEKHTTTTHKPKSESSVIHRHQRSATKLDENPCGVTTTEKTKVKRGLEGQSNAKNGTTHQTPHTEATTTPISNQVKEKREAGAGKLRLTPKPKGKVKNVTIATRQRHRSIRDMGANEKTTEKVEETTKVGRKLLATVEIGNEIDGPSDEGAKREIEEATEKTKRAHEDHKHLKCTCAMLLADHDPVMSDCTIQGTPNVAQEDLCANACSELTKIHFGLNQMVLCTHMNRLHHHFQLSELNNPNTIFCQIVSADVEQPLRYLVSWLHVILMDIVVCMTGLGIIAMYLMCFICWRKRREWRDEEWKDGAIITTVPYVKK